MNHPDQPEQLVTELEVREREGEGLEGVSGENVGGGEGELRLCKCGGGEGKALSPPDIQLSFHLPYWKGVKGGLEEGGNCSE